MNWGDVAIYLDAVAWAVNRAMGWRCNVTSSLTPLDESLTIGGTANYGESATRWLLTVFVLRDSEELPPMVLAREFERGATLPTPEFLASHIVTEVATFEASKG